MMREFEGLCRVTKVEFEGNYRLQYNGRVNHNWLEIKIMFGSLGGMQVV